ncbi:unnamed protein product, partial [Amoebophrya sp. A120]
PASRSTSLRLCEQRLIDFHTKTCNGNQRQSCVETGRKTPTVARTSEASNASTLLEQGILREVVVVYEKMNREGEGRDVTGEDSSSGLRRFDLAAIFTPQDAGNSEQNGNVTPAEFFHSEHANEEQTPQEQHGSVSDVVPKSCKIMSDDEAQNGMDDDSSSYNKTKTVVRASCTTRSATTRSRVCCFFSTMNQDFFSSTSQETTARGPAQWH